MFPSSRNHRRNPFAIVLSVLAALTAASPFLQAQDLGMIGSDIPTVEQQVVEQNRAAIHRRKQPPKALKLSQTAPFEKADDRVMQQVWRLSLALANERSLKPDQEQNVYNVLFREEEFPYEIQRANGARHAIGKGGANVTDKAKECIQGTVGGLTHVFHGIAGFSALLTEAEALRIAGRADVAQIELATPASLDIAWAGNRVDQRNLPLQSPNPTSSSSTWTGAGVHVYVIDSGIQANIAEFVGASISIGKSVSKIPTSDPNWKIGDESPFNDRVEAQVEGVFRSVGHGTGVASLIAGQTLGIAKRATLHSVRWTNTGAGSDTAIAACVDWVYTNREPNANCVVNMSCGTTPASSLIDTAVRRLINAGVTVVASAGNMAVDAINRSPARVADVITVGATDVNDAFAAFSNYGSGVDVCAPGQAIDVAGPVQNEFWEMSGTSFAAPVVTAIACQYLQQHPWISVNGTMVPQATADQVRNSIVINATRGKVTGLVNSAAATPNRLAYVGKEWIDKDTLVAGGSGSVVLINQPVEGKVYDQVLMTGSSVTIHADPGQIVRCNFIDQDNDIVQTEFSGSGNLTITLEDYSPPAYPTHYNQAIQYVKGRAKFLVEGASANTYVTCRTVGSATSTSTALWTPTPTIGGKPVVWGGIADIQSLEFSESRFLGGVSFGNASMRGSSGVVGINAPGVVVGHRLVVLNVNASGSGVPYLTVGDGSTFYTYSGRPVIASGNLVQDNGSRILISPAGFTALYTNGNNDSWGRLLYTGSLAGAKLSTSSGPKSLPFSTSTPIPSWNLISGMTAP